MIDGIGKGSHYNIGSNRNMDTRWTAVHVDDNWRLIHLDWSLKLRRQGKRKVWPSKSLRKALTMMSNYEQSN